MTKKFCTVLFVAVLTVSYAQAQFTFGVRAGFNSTRLSEKDGDRKTNSYFRAGFQIGAVSEYAISDVFVIQPSILFATQGGLIENSYYLDWKRSINYLQIPVNVLIKLNLGETKLLLQAGTYFGYALSGKYKWESKLGLYSKGEYKIKFGNNYGENMIKPFDYGIGLGAGLQVYNFQVGLGYNFGLANISPAPRSSKYSMKNNGMAVTLTYLFGK